MRKSYCWVVLVVLAASLCSCAKKEEKRTYEEIIIPPAQAPAHAMMDMAGQMGMPQMPAGGPSLKLSWQLPVDWVERQAGGMRLATFSSGNGDNAVECSIVSLGGQAGGLKANIVRWMGQINLKVPDDAALEIFISGQQELKTADNAPFLVIDFTTLQPQKDAPSMIAALITLEDATVFVKMTGRNASLADNKEKFKSLCRSLKAKK